MYAMGTKDWEQDKAKVCESPESYACQYLGYMPEGIETTPMKSFKQYSQNYITSDFQEYIDDFSEAN